MKIDTLEVAGIDIALRAMRNPLNSWDKATKDKDIELSQRLTRAGSEHSKHLRLIKVWMDIDAPRYWWQEFDTYKHVEKVSCSTMHKLFERSLILRDFENGLENGECLVDIVVDLNRIRKEYLRTKDKDLLIKAKTILPESFLQKRTVVTNYQQLLNMYKQRKHHKLPQWQMFCREIESLEDFKSLTGIKGEDE